MLANLSTEHIETLTGKLTFQLAPAVPRDNCRARDNSARRLQGNINRSLEKLNKLTHDFIKTHQMYCKTLKASSWHSRGVFRSHFLLWSCDQVVESNFPFHHLANYHTMLKRHCKVPWQFSYEWKHLNRRPMLHDCKWHKLKCKHVLSFGLVNCKLYASSWCS